MIRTTIKQILEKLKEMEYYDEDCGTDSNLTIDYDSFREWLISIDNEDLPQPTTNNLDGWEIGAKNILFDYEASNTDQETAVKRIYELFLPMLSFEQLLKDGYKKCYACDSVKKLEYFSLSTTRNSGRSSCCRECDAKKSRERRLNNEPKLNKPTEEQKEKWRANEKEMRAKYPEKYKARYLCKSAVKNGTLTKFPCDVCGELKVEAHHTDYSKPYDVTWLCKKHHGEAHRIY